MTSRSEWVFKRNCAMSPKQMALALGMLACVSAAIAVGFGLMGATWVVWFTALEWLVLLTAAAWYSRHASDQERLVVDPSGLLVEQEVAGRVVRLHFAPWGLQVQAPTAAQPLLTVQGQGQAALLGRHIRPEGRHLLAQQLRHQLRALPLHPVSVERQSVLI